MTKFNYIFGNLRTGEVVEEIPLKSVSMSRVISDDGELRGTFYLDQTAKDNATLVSATIPGQCYVIAERNSIPIWGGIVWSRTYQSQAKVMSIFCRSFEAYPDKVFMGDYANFDEQLNLFRDLWNDMQSDPDRNLSVNIPSAFASDTSVEKLIEVGATEFKSYRQIMDQIADAENGFDWTIDVSRSDGAYVKTLRMGYPTLGALQSPDSLVFEYPGCILNYWETASIGSSGTNIHMIGAGEGTGMIQSTFINQDLLDSGKWLRWDIDQARKDVTNQTVLNGLAESSGRIFRAPGNVIKVELKGDKEPMFGDYGIGDACTLIIKDPLHTDPLKIQTSVQKWEYWPSSAEEVEKAILTFEGDDS